ncbi:hypothetical protein [Nannocystis pusilla]|uniref:hypothetical protein n=1 Tax=Nannocystis pusilla TaxID=889268 RepID=UPI003DA450BF
MGSPVVGTTPSVVGPPPVVGSVVALSPVPVLSAGGVSPQASAGSSSAARASEHRDAVGRGRSIEASSGVRVMGAGERSGASRQSAIDAPSDHRCTVEGSQIFYNGLKNISGCGLQDPMNHDAGLFLNRF